MKHVNIYSYSYDVYTILDCLTIVNDFPCIWISMKILFKQVSNSFTVVVHIYMKYIWKFL